MRHDSSDTARSHATPLRNLPDYKVAEGDQDVRGWEVVDGAGHRIGTVNDLLVDTAEGRVRYLDIELDPGLYRQGTPTGLAEPEIHPHPAASTTTEYLVRASISDTENRMTADHHLDARHHPGEHHVVFPVAQAQLEGRRVILSSLRAEDAVNLPAYVPGEINPDYEQALQHWFAAPIQR
jgi:PRC-barrel domain protein